MTQSYHLAHPSGFVYPDFDAPVMDRYIARLRSISVLEQMIHSTGLKAALREHLSEEQCERILQKLSSERILQLFSEDARSGSRLLFSLLLNNTLLLECILNRLHKSEQQWILQLFGERPPALSEEMATEYVLLLTRLNSARIVAPVLITLLRNSDATIKTVVLEGLFAREALNFGMLMTLTRKFASNGNEHAGSEQEIIAMMLERARQVGNTELTNHLHIYIALIYRSLPRYQQYWAQCTELPVSSCPVAVDSPTFKANLYQLTQAFVQELYQITDDDDLLSVTAPIGWRNIQARSKATLSNPEPAIGDFIFRTFVSLLPGTIICQPEISIERKEELPLP